MPAPCPHPPIPSLVDCFRRRAAVGIRIPITGSGAAVRLRMRTVPITCLPPAGRSALVLVGNGASTARSSAAKALRQKARIGLPKWFYRAATVRSSTVSIPITRRCGATLGGGTCTTWKQRGHTTWKVGSKGAKPLWFKGAS